MLRLSKNGGCGSFSHYMSSIPFGYVLRFEARTYAQKLFESHTKASHAFYHPFSRTQTEGVGFEPTVRFPGQHISSVLLSTAQPTLH